jgi:CCR4-NOT transcription complex subunit 1
MCNQSTYDAELEPTQILQIGPAYDVETQSMADAYHEEGYGGGDDAAKLAAMAQGPALGPEGMTLANFAPYVSFNSNLPLYNAHPQLKKLVLVAIDRAVREVFSLMICIKQQIVGPVVERSVSIASVATRELILQDFSNEANEERMRRAAQLMVQNLAGNLAMVTSKEPFRISMTTQLRNLFSQAGLNEVRSL